MRKEVLDKVTQKLYDGQSWKLWKMYTSKLGTNWWLVLKQYTDPSGPDYSYEMILTEEEVIELYNKGLAGDLWGQVEELIKGK